MTLQASSWITNHGHSDGFPCPFQSVLIDSISLDCDFLGSLDDFIVITMQNCFVSFRSHNSSDELINMHVRAIVQTSLSIQDVTKIHLNLFQI